MAASSGSFEGWEAYILSQLREESGIEWVTVVQHQEPDSAPRAFAGKLRRNWRRIPSALALRIMNGIDSFLSRSAYRSIGEFDVDARYPVSKLLPDVPVLRVTPSETASRLVQRFDEETLERIAALQLDLLIRFGFKILRGKILTVARFGIISYHHADNRVNRGGPCAFWEVYDDLEETGATLQVLTDELDGGVVLRRGIYPTHRYSWNGNRRRLRAASTWLMIDAIRELARERKWAPLPDCRPIGIYSHRLYVAPRLDQSIAFVLKLGHRLLADVISRVFAMRQWRIRYQVSAVFGPCAPSAAPVGLVLRKMEELIPPRDRFFADPFLFVRNGALYLFVEDFARSTRKGVITWFVWTGNSWRCGGVALECPYHLSYPFVFEYRDRIFMIPETSAAGRVELWEADPFPDRWKLARVLLDGVRAVDSTLLARGEILYLFTNLDRSGVGDPGTELHIYCTDDLLDGRWVPHPRNPVIQDCRVARNAGGFFVDSQGRLIRAAQINGSGYGKGLVLRKVDRLSPTEYEESTAEMVEPRWAGNLAGMHHMHFVQGSAVMDSLHRIRRF